MMRPAIWRQDFAVDASELPKCKQLLKEFLAQHGAPENAIADALLVSEEILINIVQHAGLQADASISVECNVTERAELTFTDAGRVFNPLKEIPAANLEADDGERACGGFGLHLVTELSESIEYHRRDGRNVLAIKMPSHTTVSS